MKRLIINLCPTGMVTSKASTPYVPEQPEEIIEDVLMCAKQGVTMVHLHAKDENGLPTYKKEVYAKIIEGIRAKRPDLVLIVSTSGRNFNEFEKRSEALELEGHLKPDMASLTLGSLNFAQTSSCNSPEMIIKLAAKMQERGIKPELEIFDTGMINYAHYLIKKNLIEPPYYFNIILGNIATAQAKFQQLGLIISELPENSIWSIGGVGQFQKNMNMLGLTFADGIRIGLEDNIWYDDNKEILATNYMLVQRIDNIAKFTGREIMQPEELRHILNLQNYMQNNVSKIIG